MTQEEKQLLLRDLCGRLPYAVIAEYKNSKNQDGKIAKITGIWNISHKNLIMVMLYEKHGAEDGFYFPIEGVKPYLRPMSSMTDEEKEYVIHLAELPCAAQICEKKVDFFNSRHIDWQNLIPKGLALEAPEDMYK